MLSISLGICTVCIRLQIYNYPPRSAYFICFRNVEYVGWDRQHLHSAAEVPRGAKIHGSKHISTAFGIAIAHSLAGTVHHALASLVTAARAGFGDKGHIESDSDIDHIRNNEHFKRILSQM